MTRAIVVAWTVLVLIGAGASSAEGACSVQPALDAAFGSGPTSFVVRASVLQTSTTRAGLVCSGALLSLLGSSDRISATISSANNGLKGPGGDLIGYTIYGSGTTAYPLPMGVSFDFTSGQFLNLLALFGGPSTPLPMYFRTTTGANVAAGTYTDTITIDWDWNYCSGIGAFGLCLGRDIGSGQSTFQLTVTVTNACLIASAPDVTFGIAPVPSAFLPVSQQIGVVCTKGLATYSVGIDDGQHSSGGTRRMKAGSAYLEYDVFKGVTADRWGSAGASRASPPAAAHGILPESFPYIIRIQTPQPTPPAGVYQDVLVVDVTF